MPPKMIVGTPDTRMKGGGSLCLSFASSHLDDLHGLAFNTLNRFPLSLRQILPHKKCSKRKQHGADG